MHGLGSNLASVFSADRVASWRKTHLHAKLNGGEALGIYTVILCFLEEFVAPAFPRLRAAYAAFTKLGDLVRETAFGTVSPSRLRRAVHVFYAALRECDFGPHLHPKFHWLVHLPQELEKFGWLPACWTLERKHKDPKSYAMPKKNLRSYTRTLLEECVCQALADNLPNNAFDVSVGLIDARPASNKVCDVFRSIGLDAAELPNGQIAASHTARFGVRGWLRRGDVVLANVSGTRVAGEVYVAACASRINVALVALWDRVDVLAGGMITVHRVSSDNMHLCPLEDVLDVCPHKRVGANTVKLIVPFHLR